jgi:aspartyl-tRNA(Asn)/glutamyl-tRNA(Gln) amidotransferase subunit A
MYLTDVFTVSANLAGLPGVSVPCGFAGGVGAEASAEAERLPVGLQLIGRMFDEETMLRVADAYERATPWHREQPPL